MSIYKVFYTDRPLPAGTRPDLAFMLPLNFASKEEALKNAFKLIYGGAIVWEIEGPDGLCMDRDGIDREYRDFQST